MKRETAEGLWLQAVVESVQSIQADGGVVDVSGIEAALCARLGMSGAVIRSMTLACDALAKYAMGSSQFHRSRRLVIRVSQACH